MSNITIYRGDDRTLNLTFTDSSAVAIDLTGYTIFFTVKNIDDLTADDNLAVITKTVTSHTDAVNGLSAVILTDADTDITSGSYNYDIQTKDDVGNINTIVRGSFIIKDDITKRIV